MPKKQFPPKFNTTLDMTRAAPAFQVLNVKNELFCMYNLRTLSEQMLNGERIDAFERALAGAAIAHLIAIQQGVTHVHQG